MALTNRQFSILQAAVSIARNERIESLPKLLTRLNQAFPNAKADVDAAIHEWHSYLTSRHKTVVRWPQLPKILR